MTMWHKNKWDQEKHWQTIIERQNNPWYCARYFIDKMGNANKTKQQFSNNNTHTLVLQSSFFPLTFPASSDVFKMSLNSSKLSVFSDMTFTGLMYYDRWAQPHQDSRQRGVTGGSSDPVMLHAWWEALAAMSQFTITPPTHTHTPHPGPSP